MQANRLERLKAEGFELYTIVEVGLPHFVWRCDLEIEHDRHLHLSEETILRLIDAGLTTREHLGDVMGLDAVIIRNAVLNLLERHALEYDQLNNLRLSSVGKRMLQNAKVRLTSTLENIYIRHDPYHNELRWHKKEYDLNDKQLKVSGRRRIASVGPLDRNQLEERYKEVQQLIDTSGLPSDKSQHTGKREVLRVHALAAQEVYRPFDLEVWYKRESHDFGWRILRDGFEEPEVARFLDQLGDDVTRIIPSDQKPAMLDVSRENEPLHQAAEAIAQRNESSLLKTLQLRGALKKATLDAQHTLLMISPWLNQGAIDKEMTEWFDDALASKNKLKIYIGYGIERLPEQPQSPKDRRQMNALRHLEAISRRHNNRLKLFEIGNTHEKIIVVDHAYGIIGSFNFLSFNPKFERGPGVRRELSYRISQPDDVRDLADHVFQTLEEAEIQG